MKKIFIYVIGLILLSAIFISSLKIGVYQVHTPLLNLIGKHTIDATTVWDIRFPRVLGAMIIGAALGVAGSLAQGIFRNPLAEPTLIGLSSGAVLGTIVVISSGAAAYGSRANVESAVICAGMTALLVYWIAPNKGFGFLLSGVAVASVMTSLAGILISTSSKPDIQSIAFWNFGSFSLLTPKTLEVTAPYIEVGVIIAFFVSRGLDIYSLGDVSATYMGVNPKRLRLWAIIAMAFLIGASVSAVGSIAFIGLLVPHIVRLVAGPRHRQLLSLSALVGAIVLSISDLMARTLFQPHEIPIGLITAILGAPALIILLRTSKASWVSND